MRTRPLMRRTLLKKFGPDRGGRANLVLNDIQPEGRPQPSSCPLSFVLCPLSVVLCPWSIGLRPLSIHRPSSVLCPWSSVRGPSAFGHCPSIGHPPPKRRTIPRIVHRLVLIPRPMIDGR